MEQYGLQKQNIMGLRLSSTNWAAVPYLTFWINILGVNFLATGVRQGLMAN